MEHWYLSHKQNLVEKLPLKSPTSEHSSGMMTSAFVKCKRLLVFTSTVLYVSFFFLLFLCWLDMKCCLHMKPVCLRNFLSGLAEWRLRVVHEHQWGTSVVASSPSVGSDALKMMFTLTISSLSSPILFFGFFFFLSFFVFIPLFYYVICYFGDFVHP